MMWISCEWRGEPPAGRRGAKDPVLYMLTPREGGLGIIFGNGSRARPPCSTLLIWLLFEAAILPLRSDYFALAQARSRATWLRALGRRAIASSCPKASMRKKEVVCWLVWCLSSASDKVWQLVGNPPLREVWGMVVGGRYCATSS